MSIILRILMWAVLLSCMFVYRASILYVMGIGILYTIGIASIIGSLAHAHCMAYSRRAYDVADESWRWYL